MSLRSRSLVLRHPCFKREPLIYFNTNYVTHLYKITSKYYFIKLIKGPDRLEHVS